MTVASAAAKRAPRRPWARRLEAALWLAGTLTLAWVGWGYLDARLYQQRQERLLDEALAGGEPTGIPADQLAAASRPAAGGPETSAAAPRGQSTAAMGSPLAGSSATASRPAAAAAPAPRGARAAVSSPRPALDAIGRLLVPRLGVSVMVAEGVDNRTLRRAVGHIPGTSRVGSGGNAGIAGHRDSFFRPLKDVRPGDEVVLRTPAAISRYRVEWAEVVAPGDTSSLRPTPYPALTLVTCYPFHYVGTAPDRFVVRARLVESRAPTAADDAALLAARRGR